MTRKHFALGEQLGVVPVNTGSTTGQPAGVRAIIDLETVNGSTHNRSLYDIWRSSDFHDQTLRKLRVKPKFEDFGAAITEAALSGHTYVPNPADLQTLFRVTDGNNRALLDDDGVPIVVASLKHPDNTAFTHNRTVVAGTTNTTFSRLSVVHGNVLLGFGSVKPGDTLVVSGGTANDGTYEVVEVVSAFEVRVMRTSEPHTAFSEVTVSATLTVTRSAFQFRKGVETSDLIVVFNRTTPAAQGVRVHSLVGEDLYAATSERFAPEAKANALSFQDIYEQKESFLSADRSPQTAQTIQTKRGEIVLETLPNGQGVWNAALHLKPNGTFPTEKQIKVLSTHAPTQDEATLLGMKEGALLTDIEFRSGGDQVLFDNNTSFTGNVTAVAVDGVVTCSASIAGVSLGESVYLADDPWTFYTVTETQVGGDPAKLRLSPEPSLGLTTPSGIEVFSQLFDPRLVRSLGVLTKAPIIGAGDLTEGSDIFEDTGFDFTATDVEVGDILVFVGDGFYEEFEVITVAPGGNLDQLELDRNSPFTSSGNYSVEDPVVRKGLAFTITQVQGHEIHVVFTGDRHPTFSTSRAGCSVRIYNPTSAVDDNLPQSPLAERGNLVSHSRLENGTLQAGWSNRPTLTSAEFDDTSATQDSLIDPTEDLVSKFNSPWLVLGDVTNHTPQAEGFEVGDEVIPTVGADAGDTFVVTEVASASIKLDSTPVIFPNNTHDDAKVPFLWKRRSFSISARGDVKGRSFQTNALQWREQTIPLTQGLYTDASLAMDIAGNKAVRMVASGVNWKAMIPLRLRKGDILHRVEFTLLLTNGVNDIETPMVPKILSQFGDEVSAAIDHPLANFVSLAVNIAPVASKRVPSNVTDPNDLKPGMGILRAGDSQDELTNYETGGFLHVTGLTLTAGAAQVLMGRIIGGVALPATAWIYGAFLDTPYTVTSDDETIYAYLSGPDIGDTLSDVVVVYQTRRV